MKIYIFPHHLGDQGWVLRAIDSDGGRIAESEVLPGFDPSDAQHDIETLTTIKTTASKGRTIIMESTPRRVTTSIIAAAPDFREGFR